MIPIEYDTNTLLSEYNMLCGMLDTIQLQYNTAKNVLYLYLDSPNPDLEIDDVLEDITSIDWPVLTNSERPIAI